MSFVDFVRKLEGKPSGNKLYTLFELNPEVGDTVYFLNAWGPDELRRTEVRDNWKYWGGAPSRIWTKNSKYRP